MCPYGSTATVKGAAVSKQGRLLGMPTDWRILCSPISSIPAVRQLPVGKSGLAKRSSPGSPRGRKVENFDSNSCKKKKAMHRSCAKKRTEEERVIARESVQGQVWRRIAFVWRRERSGHTGVCAGHTGR